jgi:hypothetical protein
MTTYITDERLKSYLDTNQLQRERMCLAILSIDRRFSNVRPRHPRGGPDGGRDIDAIFQGEQKAFGAIGFVNQATDAKEDKKKATTKFADDLESALAAEAELKAFVFFTNVNLTVSEEEELVATAKSKGIAHSEIMDRERMRIVLDGPDGLSIRFQYLNIPMSEAEQATFFARWGDDIQSVIAEGFGEIKAALNRIQFLHEMRSLLERLLIRLELDREYDGTEIGHFRFFVVLTLRQLPDGLFMVTFGETDRAGRGEAKSIEDVAAMPAGIIHGVMGARWERRLPQQEAADSFSAGAEQECIPDNRMGGHRGMGQKQVRFLNAEYGYGDGMTPLLGPYLSLSDLDGCTFALFLNRSLANKLKVIHVYGNEYKLGDYDRGKFSVGGPITRPQFPLLFTPEELSDEWVRIMSVFGPFRIHFSRTTPARLFEPRKLG